MSTFLINRNYHNEINIKALFKNYSWGQKFINLGGDIP